MLKRYPLRSALAFLAAGVALYYASIAVIGPSYAEVCSKGEYGPPDSCTSWDIVTALVLRLLVFADEHDGIVTAFASIAVAAFTFALWNSTEKLWIEAQQQRRDARRATYANLIAARAARKSATIADRALKASNRPILAVENPEIQVFGTFTDRQGVAHTPLPRLQFSLHNTGVGIAVVGTMRVYMALMLKKSDGGVTATWENADQTINDVIKAGAKLDILEVRWAALTKDVMEQVRADKLKLLITISVGMVDIIDTPYPFEMTFDYDPRYGTLVRNMNYTRPEEGSGQ